VTEQGLATATQSSLSQLNIGRIRYEIDDPRMTDLFDDSAILKAQHSRAAEAHLATRCRWKRPDKEVAEGRASMRTATFPSTDDTVAFSDKVRGSPEIGEPTADNGFVIFLF
jgi:hypothetical protein